MKTSSLETQGKDIVLTSFKGEKLRIDPAKVDLLLMRYPNHDEIINWLSRELDRYVFDYLVIAGLDPQKKT
jgi:hypothetical protein